jgi:hypothetical protein
MILKISVLLNQMKESVISRINSSIQNLQNILINLGIIHDESEIKTIEYYKKILEKLISHISNVSYEELCDMLEHFVNDEKILHYAMTFNTIDAIQIKEANIDLVNDAWELAGKKFNFDETDPNLRFNKTNFINEILNYAQSPSDLINLFNQLTSIISKGPDPVNGAAISKAKYTILELINRLIPYPEVDDDDNLILLKFKNAIRISELSNPFLEEIDINNLLTDENYRQTIDNLKLHYNNLSDCSFTIEIIMNMIETPQDIADKKQLKFLVALQIFYMNRSRELIHAAMHNRENY